MIAASAVALFLVSMALRTATPVALPTTDEEITLEVVRRYDTIELLWAIPTVQPHFPGYYVLVDVWGMVLPLQSVRVVSVAAGSLVPVGAFLWFRHLTGNTRAMIAGLLLAFSPPLIVQSQWLRMYALLALAVLVSWWAAWSYLRGQRSAWVYGLAAGATLTLHPLSVAAIGAQVLWLADERRRGDSNPGFTPVFAGLGVLAMALLTPLVVRILGFAGGHSIGNTDLHIRYATQPVEQALALPLATVTGTAITWLALAVLICVTGLSTVLVIRRRLWTTQSGRLALFWIVASLGIVYIGHAIRPVLLLKYICWMAPGVVLLLVLLSDQRNGKSVMAMTMGVYVPNFVFGLLLTAHVAMVAVWGSGVLSNGAL